MNRTSVRSLALRQYASRFLPWLLCALIIFAGAAGIAWVSGSWFNAGLAVLLGSPIAYGYLAWGFSNDWQGLIRTPKHPWSVTVQGDALLITAERGTVEIPLQDIARSRLVQDMGWDTLKGVEDAALVLFLRTNLRVSVPGSAAGFKHALEQLKARTAYEYKEIS